MSRKTESPARTGLPTFTTQPTLFDGEVILDRAINLRQVQNAAPGAVIISQASPEYLEDLESRRRVFPAPLPRSEVNRALLDGWSAFLAPHFGDDSCNLTGTYSDDYGYSHGLMLPRNVMKDFQAYRRRLGRSHEPACIGVEVHPSTHRAILHFHAMIGGAWSDADLRNAQSAWVATRGWAVAKSVNDSGGCVEYAAKHLLKSGAADSFDFMLPPEQYGSRTERRFATRGRL